MIGSFRDPFEELFAIQRALDASAELHCTVDLTDAKGNPTCTRFRPPATSWRVVDSSAAKA